MGKIKQLTTIAAAAVASVFGIASFADNASAATMEMRYDPSIQAVNICKQVTGLQTPYEDTFIYDLTGQSTYIDLTHASVTADSAVTYSATSANAAVLTIKINNNNGADTTARKCAVLDLRGAITDTSMLYGEYTINVIERNTTGSGDNGHYYAEDPTQEISYSAYLDVDSNDDPIETNGKYGIMVKAKATPNFTSTASYTKTHIELKKQVKGNIADPDTKYNFTVQINKLSQVSPDGDRITITLPDNTTKTCNFNGGTSCTVTNVQLAHNELASIGLSGTTEQLVPGAYSYTITEVLSSNQSETKTEAFNSLSGETASKLSEWNDSTVLNRSVSKSSLGENDKYLFINTLSESSPAGRFFFILPFIILAIIAAASVVILRKSSKKEA